jgi:L-amino acid N-acyltransferase YncA
MNYIIRPMQPEDEREILAIFNYFVKNSFAAYSEYTVGHEYFMKLQDISQGYPFYVAEISAGVLAGYALLHPYYPKDAFRRAARVTYFILPEHTSQGLGAKFLDLLKKDAKLIGVDTLLASISSLNEQSLRFHEKFGFEKCGVFKAVGRKHGQDFDEVWMQKFI